MQSLVPLERVQKYFVAFLYLCDLFFQTRHITY